MHDEQFGLVYNRNRYLDPRTGRWMQRDRAEYMDGMNPHEYVRSSPVGLVDPRGGKAVRWEAVPAPGLGTARGFLEAMYDAMGNAGRWTNWLNTTEAGHRYIRDSKLFSIVEDRGKLFGHLRIDTFNKSAGDKLDRYGATDKYGLMIEGGFVAYNDPHGPPHCCDELRWSQVMVKESYGTGKPNREGLFDGFDNLTRQRHPFYFREEKPPRPHPTDILAPIPEQWHGWHATNWDGYTMHFEDNPVCEKGQWPATVRYKLCLICVTGRTTGPYRGDEPGVAILAKLIKGLGRTLKCIKYGYHVDEEGKISLEGPEVTDDLALPATSVNWLFE